MSDSTDSCEEPASNEPQSNEDGAQENAGVHFLSDRTQDEANYEFSDSREKEHDSTKEPRQKLESLEYRTRSDGSVVCKLCGEILQSRTHWYRHKYKMHVPSALQPAPLYQCEQCLAFFKSRKGYLGHMASRHSEVLTDANTTQANAQTEKPTKDQQPAPQQQQLQQHIQQQIHQQQIQQQFQQQQIQQQFQQQQLQQHLLQQQQLQQRLQQNQQDKRLTEEVNVRSLHDLVITKVPTNQQPVQRQGPSKPVEQKKTFKNIKTPVEMALTTGPGCEEKRIREEKLVSEIIDRVRKECEAQGSGGSARRGYNRRTTVMHT